MGYSIGNKLPRQLLKSGSFRAYGQRDTRGEECLRAMNTHLPGQRGSLHRLIYSLFSKHILCISLTYDAGDFSIVQNRAEIQRWWRAIPQRQGSLELYQPWSLLSLISPKQAKAMLTDCKVFPFFKNALMASHCPQIKPDFTNMD